MPVSGRTPGDIATMLLVGLAGAAAGAATVVLAVVLVDAAPAADPIDVGEPLGAPVTAQQGAALVDQLAVVGPGAEDSEIVVDVAGAVARPGLHRLRAGDRVGDAIEAAGGFAARVDLAEAGRSLNLAELLDDGTKVLVPEMGIDMAADGSSADGRVDLNHADQTALESLPGIGPVTAGKIIAARAERSFDTVRELRGRGLVGESVFDDIKDLVKAGR